MLRLALAALAGGQLPALPGALPQVEQQPSGKTVGEWLLTYEQILLGRHYRDQTLRNHRSTVKHVARLWGSQPIRDLKPHQVAAGIRALAEDSTHTACRVLACLEDIYTEAVENGEAEHNPAKVVRRPSHSTIRKRLSLEAWRAMYERSKTHPQRWLRALLLLGIVTGQRRADLAKMRFDDVVDGCLRVEQQKLAGKVRGARVAIPLTLRLEVVGMSVGDVIELCKTIAKPGDTLLRKTGGGQIEQSSLSARFHELIVDTLGPTAYAKHEWPSLHELRSLSVREYQAQGLKDRQGLLGHKDAAVTAIYEDLRDLDDDESWHVVQMSE